MDNRGMKGLKNWKKGSMGNSCRVLGKGQGTFHMDKRRMIYPQERRKGSGRTLQIRFRPKSRGGKTLGDSQRQKSK